MKKIALPIVWFISIFWLFLWFGHICSTDASTWISSFSNTWSMRKINDSSLAWVPGYTNFGETFGSWNYRWAMPTAGSIKILKKKYGIKNIITLTSLSDMPKDVQQAIKDSKLNWIVIPLWWLPPKKADRKRILDLLKQWNTFVHCMHWADRTWWVIARARVELWWVSPDTAYKDMLTYNPKVEQSNRYRKDFASFKKFIYYGYSK